MDFTFHNGTNGGKPWVEFYPYTPSDTAGYAFVGLFGIATAAHLVLMFLYRAPYFIPLFLGGICETFGYYGRAWSHQDRTDIGSWALQEMLTLCAPPFVAATIYMVLGRIIQSLDAEHLSSMRTKWLTTIFVLNDVICFLTQLAGAGVQITGDAHIMAIGVKAVLAGLVFALVVFCFFVWIAVKFHKRLDKEPTAILLQNPGLAWKRYMWALYIACFAMMIRNLVRTIQFGSGKESVLSQKEIFIYIFDGFMMFATVVILLVYHPGLLIKKGRRAKSDAHLYDPMISNRNSGYDHVPLTGYKDGQQR